MSRNVVNLDALLPRANLDAPEIASAADVQGFKVGDLEPGLIYNWLRKPDFQRETASWSPEQIVDLIVTFASGNIIPAIVLWQNGQSVFVIDGAHRLSALIAWVRDDYGAGEISALHYQNVIPEHQKKMHDATRDIIKDGVKSYRDHKLAAQFPNNADPEVLARASKFPFRNIEIQWIRNASIKQAKESFFRINQGGVKIDAIETRILRANNSAVAISARAISRGGTGHDYWSRFEDDVKKEIVKLSGEISKLLFSPNLVMPVNTLDVPLAGFGYGSHVLPFAFDLVNVANGLGLPDSTRKAAPQGESDIPDDTDGRETCQYLRKVKDLVELLCSKHSGSLGLHPALYFYSPRGDFLPTAFFNVSAWVMELETRRRLQQFKNIRGEFENLILSHPVISKPAVHSLGSGGRSRLRTTQLFSRIFDLLSSGGSPDNVWATVISEPDFHFLLLEDEEQQREATQGLPGRPFPRRAKSAGFLRQALPQALRCSLCGGLMHMNGMTSDHTEERNKMGTSADENARSVHPICNSSRET